MNSPVSTYHFIFQRIYALYGFTGITNKNLSKFYMAIWHKKY